MKSRAAFLGRDGTMAPDVGYCSRPEDFELCPGAGQAARLLNWNGFKVVVITNQSGVACSHFTEDALDRNRQEMRGNLEKHSAWLDGIYYCPRHPDDGCSCRKAGTALFRQAAEELAIDLGSSFVTGDMQLDIDAGKDLGCRTVLVTTGPKAGRGIADLPDYTTGSLLEAAEWVTRNRKWE